MIARESWWAINPPHLQNLAAQEHRLLTPRLQRTRTTLWQLDQRSGQDAHEAAAVCASAWQKELDQMPAFNARRPVRWEEEGLWIWTLPGGNSWNFTVAGACGLERDTMTHVTPIWRMTFCWLHPYARHRGVFRASWPILLRRYEPLAVETLSLSIRAAVHGTPSHEIPTMAQKTLRLYTENPWCPIPHHGPMFEPLPGVWRCGFKQDDGSVCAAKYPTPAQAQRTR